MTDRETWTLVVYRADMPHRYEFDSEAEARDEAHRLEVAWEEGIPDSLIRPDGTVVWHRGHDAAG